MHQIRIYLLTYSPATGWTAASSIDLDEIIEAWRRAKELPNSVGIVHVGTRSIDGEFEKIAMRMADGLLLSTSARWAFADRGAYSSPIATVDGLGIHLVESGWGYSAGSENVAQNAVHSVAGGTNESGQSASACQASFKAPMEWFEQFSMANPSLAREARSKGICDEITYQNLEASLPWGARGRLGVERMSHLMWGADPNNPIAVAKASPPWLLEMPFDLIELTVRCRNCLAGESILTPSDLLKMNFNDLNNIQNFGKKSQSDLAQALTAAAKNGPNAYGGQAGFPSGIEQSAIARGSSISSRGEQRLESESSFAIAFSANLKKLKEAKRTVLLQRLGASKERMTLEEVASGLSVTRERVRQIESDAVKEIQFDPVWKMECAPRIARLLDGREDPLPASSLGLFDPWFAGIEEMMPQLRFAVAKLLGGKFHILEINGCEFITEINKSEWIKTVRHAINFLERAVVDVPRKGDIRQTIEELLGGDGRELRSELWGAVQSIGIFAADSEGVERLNGVGTSAEAMVSAVLFAAPQPLHYKEIWRRIEEQYSKTFAIQRVLNASAAMGVRYGRGMFGTVSHCPLTQEEMRTLREEAEDVVLSGPAGRQWTCFEIVEKLGSRSLEFGDRINQYVLDFVLKSSKSLSNLGRLVWVSSSDRRVSTADRIEVAQAILAVIDAAGRPMTREELRAALMRDRGLSEYFQLIVRGSLVRVGANLWGRLERDIPLDANEIDDVRERVEIILNSRQSGIHVTELMAEIQPFCPAVKQVADPYAIASILQTYARFKFSRGEYVFLADWEGARRLTQVEAVVEALRSANGGGLTIAELSKRVESILGRPMERASMNGALAMNAQYDDESGTWALLDDEPVAAD